MVAVVRAVLVFWVGAPLPALGAAGSATATVEVPVLTAAGTGAAVATRALPAARSLSNEATRAWYKNALSEIPKRLNQAGSLRDRALQAFKMRNEIKLQARELMADRAAANSLPSPRTLADVVKRAYQSGARGDDIWRYVLRGSGKSNAAVDPTLGL